MHNNSFLKGKNSKTKTLKPDLSEGVYLPQNSSSCSRLCPKSDISKSSPDVATKLSACCDPKAVCSCGTHTGHFACICPPGHFGRGLMGDCNRELPEFKELEA